MYSKSVSILRNVPISYLTYKETGDSSLVISPISVWPSIITELLHPYCALLRMQHFHCNSQKHASIYVGKFMRWLVPLWLTLEHIAILLPSRLTVVVKVTTVILQNISQSISTIGDDSVSFSFRVLN
jgi:hypothetical protein